MSWRARQRTLRLRGQLRRRPETTVALALGAFGALPGSRGRPAALLLAALRRPDFAPQRLKLPPRISELPPRLGDSGCLADRVALQLEVDAAEQAERSLVVDHEHVLDVPPPGNVHQAAHCTSGAYRGTVEIRLAIESGK